MRQLSALAETDLPSPGVELVPLDRFDRDRWTKKPIGLPSLVAGHRLIGVVTKNDGSLDAKLCENAQDACSCLEYIHQGTARAVRFFAVPETWLQTRLSEDSA
jgi:hypothetical protein